MKKSIFLCIVLSVSLFTSAQYRSCLSREKWVDSVFNSLTEDQRIGQLMVVRAHSNLGPDHVAKVEEDIRKYDIGALCFFQGGPIRQANLTNYYQSIAQTPLMITIDGEWGLGMRLDSVNKFPFQLTLGAMNDQNLVYRMGLAIGEQCKRIGVHVNYAPVVDVNNNPNNPVIGYRSFGENKYKVADYGVAYMKGMQDAGIMACAKHFPGHGDVDVDSHLDLPVINKSIADLDSLELIPFRAVFDAGIGSVMIAHLSVPALDTASHVATSISKNSVTGLLRDSMHFNGLTFTDALEMKGVAKYFPGGTISVQALIAGNDMLCLPSSVSEAITQVKAAIADNRLSWDDINAKVKKVLASKYQLGLNQWKPIDTTNLLSDLNAKTDAIRYEAAAKSVTLLKNAPAWKTPKTGTPKNAYVGIGSGTITVFGRAAVEAKNADTYLLSYKDGTEKVESILNSIRAGKYDNVILSISDYSLRPAKNYGFSDTAIELFRKLQSFNTQTWVFGNVLALKNFCEANTLYACYQDDSITHLAATAIMKGNADAAGTIPVTVCKYPFGTGIVKPVSENPPHALEKLAAVDSIINDALAQKAFPGCVVMAVHEGEIVYHKAFGHYQFDPASPKMDYESVFDLASVTKVSATTVSVMRLYEEGKLDLKKTLGDYLPLTKGTNKAGLQLDDVLLHQAGLTPFIAFYRETIDTATGVPNPNIYSDKPKPGFTVRVAENIYMRNDWNDTMFARILKSPVGPGNKYIYSDLDFIFLGKVVESVTGMPLDQYVQKTFYTPMGMGTTGFKPRERFPANKMVPTETEKHFRRQTMQGDVHDEGAAMFGGVAGHAGLFSDAYDLAMLYQMLENGGTFNGVQYIKPETIKYFTGYHSKVSRRGYGFDKPEKDNAIRKDPYPAQLASGMAFGHTGFTGTSVWVDPKYKLVYIFLSNRVNPTRDNNKLSQLLIRGKIQDALCRALGY